MKKRGKQTTKPEPVSALLQSLLDQEVSREELLSAGQYRETGSLSQLTRYELQELVPSTAGIMADPLPREDILRLARWVVERALLVKFDAAPEKLEEFDAKAAKASAFIYSNHAARVAAKTEATARRSANTMADETVAGAVAPKAAKKAAKKTATKAAAAKKEKTAAAAAGPSVYDTMVVATKKEVREGSFFDKVVQLAKAPIKLETLIQKLIKEVGPTLRSTKDPEIVVRARTRDAFSRLGFLKEAKG
jgi:hypothetical protein